MSSISKINLKGTDYDISASKLKTARNITIGASTKAFDGTSDISFNLGEIHTYPWKNTNIDLTGTDYDADTYYLVTVSGNDYAYDNLLYGVCRQCRSDTWSNHGGKTLARANIGVSWIPSGWGSNNVWLHVLHSSYNWTATNPFKKLYQSTNSSRLIFYIRGGGYYSFYTNGATPVLMPDGINDTYYSETIPGSYAKTDTALTEITTLLSAYLPRSGGTMSGDITFPYGTGIKIATGTSWDDGYRTIPFSNASDPSKIQWYSANATTGLTFNAKSGTLKTGGFQSESGGFIAPAKGSNPRTTYHASMCFYNCNPETTSAYNFGVYQWNDEFQFNYRTSATNTFKGNSFTIRGSDGLFCIVNRPVIGSYTSGKYVLHSGDVTGGGSTGGSSLTVYDKTLTIPTSLPASDVYDWAKASTKPSYAWSEITDKPSTFTPASHTHSYLPLSGGTMTGKIYRNYASASAVPFIHIGANNVDATMLRVYSSDGTETSNYNSLYGYSLIYRGSGSGINNRLDLMADNQTSTQVTAISVNNQGDVGIKTTPTQNVPLTVNGSISATRLTRTGNGSYWYAGRTSALVRTTSVASDGWNVITSLKTKNGDWSTGVLGSTDKLEFCYTTDTDFNAGPDTNVTMHALSLDNTGNLTTNGSTTSSKFIKSGGTSSQFLKADGSVDSNSYSTTSHTHTKSQITDFPASLKNPNSLTVKLNSGTTENTNLFTYDGSAAKTVDITPSAIGAATRGHTHSTYFPYSGGTFTGPISFNTSSLPKFSGAPPFIVGIEAFADGGILKWADADAVKVGTATTSSYSSYLGNSSANYSYSTLKSALDGKSSTSHTHNYATTVKIGTDTTSYTVSSNTITLPAYPTASSLGLSSAMKFIGTTTTALTDGSTTNTITIGSTSVTATSGNVVLYGNKEFLWNGSTGKWEELGDESSHALKTVSIKAGTGLSGGGTLEADRTLSLNTAGTDTLGGIKVGSNLSIDSNGVLSGTANTTYSAGTGLTLSGTSFSLNTAGSALGGVKTTSTVTSNSGYTACPIIGGVPYYKDTNTTYNFSGYTFYSSNSNNPQDCNNCTTNGVYYYKSSNGPSGITAGDGALYTQAYSTSWVGQIAQDYRSGHLFLRGKNNGKWTDWLTNCDSSNTYISNGTVYINGNSIKPVTSETSLSKGTTSGSGNAVTDISVSGHKITLTKDTTFLTAHQDISGKSNTSHTHSVKINGTTKTIAASGGTAVDLGTYLTAHQDISGKQDKSTAVTHTASTAVGSSTKPVYIASDGTATAIGYTIAKSVPSNAVFTDTNQTVKGNGTGFGSTAAIDIVGSGATTVTADTTNNQITISSTNTVYSLPTATSSVLGGVKSATTGTTANRDYKVQVNSDGTMKVNVPWTDTYTQYPYGFSSRLISSWGNQIGTIITDWHTASGGDVQWMNDNPVSGQVSLKVDGTVYINEGKDAVASQAWVNNKGYTTNTGTVTSVAVKMNGASKGTVTTSGTIDLGTVLTDDSTYFKQQRTSTKSIYDYVNDGTGDTFIASLPNGTYSIPYTFYDSSGNLQSSHSELLVRLALNAGSTSALEFWTNYGNDSALKYRKTIDNNRISGAWKTIANTDYVDSSINSHTHDDRYYTESETDNKLSAKQDKSTAVTHTASTAVGSSTQPVYIASDGKATAIGYTIAKSVPSNAIFTDTNTTYSAGTGLTLSGTTFSNSGVRSISTGTANGTISVNTGGTTGNVAVKGLGSAAYTASSAYATASHTHSYLPLSGGGMTGSIHSRFTSNTWVNSLTDSVITLDHTGYSGWICGPTKSGRIAISTYPGSDQNDNNLYFGWGETGRTENSFASQMWWDGAKNVLYAGTFKSIGGAEVSYNGHTHPQYLTSIPIASSSTLGGIKVGSNLTISSDGTLSGTADTNTWRPVVDNLTSSTSTTSSLSAKQGYLLANGSAKDNSAIASLSASGTTITYTKRDGSTGTITTQDTHYRSANVVTNSATSAINTSTALTNGNVYLNHWENGTSILMSSHKISGTGATTVTTDTKGNILINSTDTNTHYASSTIVSNAATGTGNASTSISNGKVYLNHIENGAVKSSHLIKGSGATTVTANSSNQIIISSTNTTYSASGLNKLSGTTMYGNGVVPAIFMSPLTAVNVCLCEHLYSMITNRVIEASYGDTLCTDLYLYMAAVSDNGGTNAIKNINASSSDALANQLYAITSRLNSLYGNGAIRPRTFTIHFYLYSASTNTQRIPVLIGCNDESDSITVSNVKIFTGITEWLPGYYQIKFMYSDSRTAYFVNTKDSLESGGCLGAESPSRLWQIHISRFM